ncbi:VOC family protein [Candidatus Woesearchaeota archaeon]|nr:VOC family protein [Nanoarchaeota archaeon]MCB9370511.1 VOC family protein [Candidatus Woesearchaeota archaeon]USN44954.1 MAG: VOC family protein [Candidatus Woesearchaeota archaeon]
MNPVVHFEMPYEDAKRMISFYESVFGWEMKELGEAVGNYVLAKTAMPHEQRDKVMASFARGAIDGGFFPRKPDWPAQYPSVVIAVDDINVTMTLIRERGGEVLGEPMEIPGTGTYVSFLDTEGNRVSILEPLGR